MAAKKSKISDTQRVIAINPNVPSTSLMFGETSKLLGLMNRRLYRQGRTYRIRFRITDTNTAAFYRIFVLRNDYVLHNAWKMAYQSFLTNSIEEMDQLKQGGGTGRYLDFRIKPLTSGASVAEPLMFTASGVIPAALTPDEYEYSVVTPEGSATQKVFTFSGGTSTAFNILEEYDHVYNADIEPDNAPGTIAYDGLTQRHDDLQILHLTQQNNQPPYDGSNTGSGVPWVLHDVKFSAQETWSHYVDAPLGIFVIQCCDSSGSPIEFPTLPDAGIMLEVAPGNYKGVNSASMGTAKRVSDHYEVR